jgi:predicted anti-sigma-YlaC factor YlaD
MVCQYLEDLFELYLLGVATPQDAAAVEDHLQSGCAGCLQQVREAALTVYLLCLPPKPARPDPKRKAHLLHRLKKK